MAVFVDVFSLHDLSDILLGCSDGGDDGDDGDDDHVLLR